MCSGEPIKRLQASDVPGSKLSKKQDENGKKLAQVRAAGRLVAPRVPNNWGNGTVQTATDPEERLQKARVVAGQSQALEGHRYF